MFKTLRIIFCILAVAALAAAIFVFVYLGLMWGFVTLVAALIFIVLMYVFKNLQGEDDKNLTDAAQDDRKDDNLK